MRSLRLLPFLLMVLVPATRIAAQAPAEQAPGVRSAGTGGPAAPPMQMTMDFPDGGQLPVKNSGLVAATGYGTSPEIHWSNPPAGTMSFVLYMEDIDFSRNRTTVGNIHWLVWNIPATEKGLPEGVPNGQLKKGAYQTSATGPGIYRAPNGPGRKHHYVFQLLALDIKLDTILPGPMPFDTLDAVMKAAQGHILSRINWVTTFGPN